MGEFSVKDKGTYIEIDFPQDRELWEYEGSFEMGVTRAASMGRELQRLNKGKTVVVVLGNMTMVLDGTTGSLNPDKIGDILG